AGRPVLSELARSVEFGFTAALLCGVLAVILVVVAFPLGETVYVQQRHSLVPGATQMVARKAPNLILVGLGLCFLVAAGLGGVVASIRILVWLARKWEAVPAEFGGMSGVKAVGLLFVPWFNIYWMFRVVPGLSAALSRALRSYDPDAPAHAGLAAGLTACLLAFVPGLNVLTLLPLLVWLKAADRAASRLAIRSAAETEGVAAGEPAPASQEQ